MARWRLTTLEPKQLMEPLMERHHRLPVQLAGLCSVQLFLQNPRQSLMQEWFLQIRSQTPNL